MNKILQLSNVSFAYDKDWILEQVNIEIHVGEFVAVIGENGVGKSTLLNLMIGNLVPQSGSISLFEKKSIDNKSYDKIAYISQGSVSNYKNFPTTVQEVIKIHARYLKKDKEVSSYLELVNLQNQRNKVLSELSGGQLQRVAILLALIKEAELIILDEPTTGVDQKFSHELYEILKGLCAKGKTVLMVTHQFSDVQQYVNRLLKIQNKEVVEVSL